MMKAIKFNSIYLLALLLVLLVSSGCSTPIKSKADPDFATVRPVDAQPLPINTGSIYKSGYDIKLFENAVATKVGDILTVVFAEKTNASKSAKTNTKKDTEDDIAAPLVLGRGITHSGVQLLNTDLDAKRKFKGEGDSTQSNSLTGTISVTVAEVLANGNLVVQGEKLIALNQGVEYIRVAGIVRPADISPENTVKSTKIAKAQIVYGGEGAINEVNEKGWLDRIMNSALFPF